MVLDKRAFHGCARISADHAHKALAPFSSHSGKGPMVRIRRPPALSLSQWCVPVRAGEKAESSRRFAGGLGREKGRASDGPTVLGNFSLTGIDAVPLWESSGCL